MSELQPSLSTRWWNTAFLTFRGPKKVSKDPIKRYRADLGKIVREIIRLQLEPNPENYEAIYRRLMSDREEALLPLNEIKHKISAHDLNPDHQESEFRDELDDITGKLSKNIDHVYKIIEHTSKNTNKFRKSIILPPFYEQNSVSPDVLIKNLCDISLDMVEKLKNTEKELVIQSACIAELQESLIQATEISYTDSLTGLTNRRAFERQLGAACERARSTGINFSLAICDIDHFKRVNDTYGHQIGDRVLRYVSNVLTHNLADLGHIFRFGGEEFVILLEGFSGREAKRLIDDTREDLAGRTIKNRDNDESLGKISFSAGISCFTSELTEGRLLELADIALYQAKDNGRNQVILSERDPDKTSFNNKMIP